MSDVPEKRPCRLCLDPHAQLQDSHIISKWSYRNMRSPEARNPNPLVIHDGVGVQTSEQIREHLLCSKCEARFGKWESYVRLLVYTGNKVAPIFRRAGGPVEVTPATDGRQLRFLRLAGVDSEAIGQFGLSLFWRSHVSSRRDAGSAKFGDRLGEMVRLFLLGQGPFPECLSISLALLDPTSKDTDPYRLAVYIPRLERREGYNLYQCLVAGFSFSLVENLGGFGSPLSKLKEVCLIRASEKRASVDVAHELGLIHRLGLERAGITPHA